MRQRIINFLLRGLLNMVVLDDVIKTDKGNIYLGGKLIGETELRSLIAECKALQRMYIWKIINETVKNDAMERGWNNSTTIGELNTGKTIFYTLKLQNSIINAILSKDSK